jgi:phosphate acetyltransferase
VARFDVTRIILVAPTGHRVGLTSTCIGLVTALDRAGVAVGFAKPIGQPRADGADHSAELVRLTSNIVPARPSRPIAPRCCWATVAWTT